LSTPTRTVANPRCSPDRCPLRPSSEPPAIGPLRGVLPIRRFLPALDRAYLRTAGEEDRGAEEEVRSRSASHRHPMVSKSQSRKPRNECCLVGLIHGAWSQTSCSSWSRSASSASRSSSSRRSRSVRGARPQSEASDPGGRSCRWLPSRLLPVGWHGAHGRLHGRHASSCTAIVPSRISAAHLLRSPSRQNRRSTRARPTVSPWSVISGSQLGRSGST
jgi:hypothetical protein